MIGIHARREDVVADDFLRSQLLVRLVLQFSCLHLRLCSSQVCLSILHVQLMLRLVDDEQRLTLLHFEAVLEVHLSDDARHLREDFHLAQSV